MSGYSVAESTKERLICAAGQLAAQHGIDNVSTRAIAELSGENIGSIHYHFGGRDGLMEEMVRWAIEACRHHIELEVLGDLPAHPTPEELSKAVRQIVVREMDDLFRSNRPLWHSQVIYQLMQRDDELYHIFRRNVMEPNLDGLFRFFRVVDPTLTDEQAFAHVTVLKMPIFAHANYRKAMLDHLGTEDFRESYFQTLEDLLVKQTQLLLGLPED
ncbi:TetR/AcrR family transcriptional regulator [Pontiella agarivorans]|uniref:TetR/AcrR family transcriptional regulator n=1 Tax=Pontiella agarivorans TaxID=3038953 RepID=A0ABU5MX83_9BACT|nr:TetR/AcrR family transcriptional regulator [Pontiella agarivorans]MDZ8118803.1 TetR/AcrR family transcriptional regulator [Pontiella agarivorans]